MNIYEGELLFKENDSDGRPTGREGRFLIEKFTPLAYRDLVDLKTSEGISIPIAVRSAKVVDSSFDGINPGASVDVNATLNSPLTSKVIGLVRGGWLPSGMVHQSSLIMMPDRCTVSSIHHRFGQAKSLNSNDQDFVDLFRDTPIKINPILYVIEGKKKRPQTPSEMIQQLDEVRTLISNALPKAQILGDLRGMLGIANDTRKGCERKQTFLLKVASRLASPIARKNQGSTWKDVIATAADCKLPKHSLPVIAALSAIVAPQRANPARTLLKFGGNYNSERAYNAVADLRALELFIALLGYYPNYSLMLCTNDVDLALFWAGLRASQFSYVDGASKHSLSPAEDLLTGADEAMLDEFFTPESRH